MPFYVGSRELRKDQKISVFMLPLPQQFLLIKKVNFDALKVGGFFLILRQAGKVARTARSNYRA